MGKLIRTFVFLIAAMMGLAQGFIRHTPPAARASDTQAAVADAANATGGGNDAYNPWGITKAQPGQPAPAQPKVLVRDASGQFHVNVMVNGHDTRFLVDTGADLVALTPSEAARVGLRVDEADYRPVLRTASGTGMGADVVLDQVDLVGRRLTYQRAVVARGLDENLLGQSVLRNLGRVELKGDTMVLMPN